MLGHALYMKAIHGGKAKNDKIDAHKIAALLRGGMMPQAYVYPAVQPQPRRADSSAAAAGFGQLLDAEPPLGLFQ